MPRLPALLAVCGLVLAAGCLGGPPVTPTLSVRSAGERAVDAEQARVERVADGYANLSGLSFGILDPAEHEVVRRNATGVIVRVDVGYSVSVDCDGDGEPDSAVDGANTLATYFVTADRVRLLAVAQDFFDPTRHC